jgi:ADP-ribose pyrophosphatase YjhB (NUDIX family)
MNKIFINDRAVYLLDNKDENVNFFEDKIHYSNPKNLEKSISDFEKKPHLKNMTIVFDSENQKNKAIEKIFKIIEAAGGIVKNKEGKILFIFRHGKWDLPKGKIEKGEIEKDAALREVVEECGIQNLELGEKFTSTYHTYQLKGKNILKISHWYTMRYSGDSLQLIPQLEEGITDARWLDENEIKEAMENTFASIVEVMKLYFSK